MTIFNTIITKYHSQYFGWTYKCYKYQGKRAGDVCYCMNIWEVIKFIVE